MYKTLTEVFEKHLPDIVFDKKLYLEIQKFRLEWSQKSNIYPEYLGSNLTGVHPVRFSSQDEDKFFIDLLNADQTKLRNDLHNVKGIIKTRIVTSNVTYLTLSYLMHGFINSKLIGRDRDNALKEVYYIFAYKVMTSLLSRYFKNYNADVALAKAVYEKLSNKFLLKKLGSWQALYEYRAKDILPPSGLHAKRLARYTVDDATRTIQDLQGRLRDILKVIYGVLMELKQTNEKINYSAILEEQEDGVGLKDITNDHSITVSKLHNIFNKENDFINDDLIYLVTTLFKNIDRDNITETLRYMSSNIIIKPGDKDDFISATMLSAFKYLRTKGIVNNYNKEALKIIITLKGYWSSSSNRDKSVAVVKKRIAKIVEEATGKRTKWISGTIAIGIMIYIFLRGIKK